MFETRLQKPRIMKKIILLIFLSVFFISCSPQIRLQRLIKNHPELTTKDTIRITHTVIIPGVKLDTAFIYDHCTDTIIINKDRFNAEIIIQKDSIYFHGECKPDTITDSIKIPYEKIVPKYTTTNKTPWYWYVITSLTSIAALFFLGKWIFKN